MIYTDLTVKAMKIADEAHRFTYDKGGAPYIFHPIHLAEQMDDEISTCCALLHDVVEDTNVTFDYLVQIFPEEIINTLILLTHDKKDDYFDYIKAGLHDEVFRKVKKADLLHNSDFSRLKVITDKDIERNEKYEEALEMICQFEEELKPVVYSYNKD